MPPEYIGLTHTDTGERIEESHDLLVVDDDPIGFLQERCEAFVHVVRLGFAVARLQVVQRHVGFHRTWPKQRDLHRDVIERAWLEFADQFHLPWAFKLEHTQGASGAEHVVGGFVIEGDAVKVDHLTGESVMLLYGVTDGGHHPDAQNIQLDKSHGIHVVLVELAHRQSHAGGLHGGSIKQRNIGQDDPARVDGDVPRQSVQTLGETDQHFQLLGPFRFLGDLGKLRFLS